MANLDSPALRRNPLHFIFLELVTTTSAFPPWAASGAICELSAAAALWCMPVGGAVESGQVFMEFIPPLGESPLHDESRYPQIWELPKQIVGVGARKRVHYQGTQADCMHQTLQ